MQKPCRPQWIPDVIFSLKTSLQNPCIHLVLQVNRHSYPSRGQMPFSPPLDLPLLVHVQRPSMVPGTTSAFVMEQSEYSGDGPWNDFGVRYGIVRVFEMRAMEQSKHTRCERALYGNEAVLSQAETSGS